MEQQIRHRGIIESIGNGHVQVRILQTSACAGCHIASHCHTSESSEKMIDVSISDSSQWQKGQCVVVSTQSTMVGQALLVSFGIPLLVMMAMLAVSVMAGFGQVTTALLMLLSLLPYFFIVWLCRNHIARTITFKLEKTNE